MYDYGLLVIHSYSVVYLKTFLRLRNYAPHIYSTYMSTFAPRMVLRTDAVGHLLSVHFPLLPADKIPAFFSVATCPANTHAAALCFHEGHKDTKLWLRKLKRTSAGSLGKTCHPREEGNWVIGTVIPLLAPP